MPSQPLKTGAQTFTVRNPEGLNEAIRLTSRATWLMLGSVALCVAGVAVWSMIGQLDFHASGPGVIMLRQSEVADVVARAGGRVSNIAVTPGQRVAAGALLVSIKLDEIDGRLQQAQIALTAQRDALAKYAATSSADIVERKQDLALQLQSLQTNLVESGKSRDMLQVLYNNYQSELDRGLATRDQVQATYDRLNNVQQSLRTMQDKTATLKTDQIEFEDQISRSLTDMQMKVIDADAQQRDLQVQYDIGSSIRSPADGLVSEITTQLNATVASGSKLVVIETGAAARQMLVHAYLPVDQGKRVNLGMPVEVSPSSVDERIYGSIRGEVISLSTLPKSRDGLLAVLGTPALVDTMMAKGAPIEVVINLTRDAKAADGLSWTSSTSPPTAISPGTTATSRIVVDRVKPITLILPMARAWTVQ